MVYNLFFSVFYRQGIFFNDKRILNKNLHLYVLFLYLPDKYYHQYGM